jgi:hypothetical protein
LRSGVLVGGATRSHPCQSSDRLSSSNGFCLSDYPQVPLFGEQGFCWSKIKSIDFLSSSEFWDLYVPIVNNYLAEGVFHHQSGKDWLSARSAICHLCTYYPAKVLVFGPSSRQVSEIVFREMRDAYDHALACGSDLGGEMYRKAPRWQIDNKHFALGFATDVSFNLTGFHSPNLYVIITEAHAMEQAHINKIKTLHPKKILMTGNPFAEIGEFWESHHNKRHLWKTITISAFDTPNVIEGREVIPGLVTLEGIRAAQEDWGVDNPLYIASILGQFPDSLSDSVVSLSFAVAATKRDTKPEGPKIAACDVSRYGTARTCIAERQGMFVRFMGKWQGKPTTYTEAQLKLYLDENPDVVTLFIDDTGIGGGVTDHLLEDPKYQQRVVPFIAGAVAQSKRFGNATTEAWWAMREAYMVGGLRTPDDQNLIAQVVSRKYKLHSDKTIRLESKEDMHKKGQPSPDEGDSVAMTFAKRPAAPNLLVIDVNQPSRDEPTEAELEKIYQEREAAFLRGDDLED